MPRRGPLLVFLAAVLWGTTGTAQALGPEGITAATVGFVRMVGGSLLVGYAVIGKLATPLRRLPIRPTLIAIAAMASSQPLFFAGVARTGVAIGTIVTIGVGPILAGVLGWVVRRERVEPRWHMATALSVGGALLLVSGGESAGVDPAGLGFAFAAGAVWAGYLLSAKALFDSVDPVYAAGVVFVGAAIVLSPVLILSDPSWMVTAKGLLVVLWLAPITAGLSYVFFSRGLQETNVAVAATMSLSEPLTAAVLGLAVLGEPARPSTVAGIALIVAGLVLLARE
jgi:DME family drug/metabolite transporter